MPERTSDLKRCGVVKTTSGAAANLDQFFGNGGLDALSRETLQATGLPGKAYGAAFYEIEQRTLFPKIWCAAGVASDLPNPGDMLPVDIAGWPVLLLRND